MVREFIIKNFPSLGKYKRRLKAIYHHYFWNKLSYSQHKEDTFIWRYLKSFDLSKSIYIDVGANHPTDISNTYLLYKQGLKGIIIEPNTELIRLFELYRKNDTLLAIAASDFMGVLKFYISKTPVLSSFSKEVDFYKTVFVPVLTVDSITKNLDFTFINLLSIDVEGFNKEVLDGSATTLEKTLLLCIEFDSDEEKNDFIEKLRNRFDLLSIYGCNLIFENRNLKQDLLNS